MSFISCSPSSGSNIPPERSFGIVRIRPISAVETACGCRLLKLTMVSSSSPNDCKETTKVMNQNSLKRTKREGTMGEISGMYPHDVHDSNNNKSLKHSTSRGDLFPEEQFTDWRELWKDNHLFQRHSATYDDMSDSQGHKCTVLMQRKKPTDGRIEAYTLHLTKCLVPAHVNMPTLITNVAGCVEEITNSEMIAHATQGQLYESFGPAAISAALKGHHCAVLMYGATGSGKSYSLLGTNNDPGVFQLILSQLTRNVSSMSNLGRKGLSSNSLRGLRISIFDIDANDEMHDLLSNFEDPDSFRKNDAVTESREGYNDNPGDGGAHDSQDIISSDEEDDIDIYHMRIPKTSQDKFEVKRRSRRLREFLKHLTCVDVGNDFSVNEMVISAIALRRAKLQLAFGTNRIDVEAIKDRNQMQDMSKLGITSPNSTSPDYAPYAHVGVNDDYFIPPTPDSYESSATTIIRLELLLNGGKTVTGAQAEDLVGVIDFIECAGSEHLLQHHIYNESKMRYTQSQKVNKGAHVSGYLDPGVDVTNISAHRQVSSYLPCRSLLALHSAISHLGVTKGDAANTTAAVKHHIGDSYLTLYLKDVLCPPELPYTSHATSLILGKSDTSTPLDTSLPATAHNEPPFLNGRLFFVGTISGADAEFESSLHTMRLAESITRIATFPQPKRDWRVQIAAKLREQIDKTKIELERIERTPIAHNTLLITNASSMNSSFQSFQGGLRGVQHNGDEVFFGTTQRVLMKVNVLKKLADVTEEYRILTQSFDERAKRGDDFRAHIHQSLEYCLQQYEMVVKEVTLWQVCQMAGGGQDNAFRQKMADRASLLRLPRPQISYLGSNDEYHDLHEGVRLMLGSGNTIQASVPQAYGVCPNAADSLDKGRGAEGMNVYKYEDYRMDNELALALLNGVDSVYSIAPTVPMLITLNHSISLERSLSDNHSIFGANGEDTLKSVHTAYPVVSARMPKSNVLMDQVYFLHDGGTSLGNCALASFDVKSNANNNQFNYSDYQQLGQRGFSRWIHIPELDEFLVVRFDVDQLRQEVTMWPIGKQDIASHVGRTTSKEKKKKTTTSNRDYIVEQNIPVFVNGIKVKPILINPSKVNASKNFGSWSPKDAQPMCGSNSDAMTSNGYLLAHMDRVVIGETVAFRVQMPLAWEQVKSSHVRRVMNVQARHSSEVRTRQNDAGILNFPVPTGIEIGISANGTSTAAAQLYGFLANANSSAMPHQNSNALPDPFMPDVDGMLYRRYLCPGLCRVPEISVDQFVFFSLRHILLAEEYNRFLILLEELVMIREDLISKDVDGHNPISAVLMTCEALFAYQSAIISILTKLSYVEQTLMIEFPEEKLVFQAWLPGNAGLAPDVSKGEDSHLSNDLALFETITPSTVPTKEMIRAALEKTVTKSTDLGTEETTEYPLNIGQISKEDSNTSDSQRSPTKKVVFDDKMELMESDLYGEPNLLASLSEFYRAMEEVANTTRAERRARDLEEESLRMRAATLFAFVNPLSASNDPISTSLFFTPREADRVIAIKQRLLSHMRKRDGAGKYTVSELIRIVDDSMDGKELIGLLTAEELALLRRHKEEAKIYSNQMKLLKDYDKKHITDAELLEMAMSALASSNTEPFREAARFRLEYELNLYQSEMHKSRMWLHDGPLDPPWIQKEYLCLTRVEYAKPTINIIRRNTMLDDCGGLVIKPMLGAASGTQTFESYFYKLRIRRTIFHKGGGFHKLYGVIRGRFFYYFKEENLYLQAIGGIYMYGAKIRKSSLGLKPWCLRILPTSRRKTTKGNDGPETSEMVLAFDTKRELDLWYDRLSQAAYPPMTPLLKQAFGIDQLSHFVEDAGLMDIISAGKVCAVDQIMGETADKEIVTPTKDKCLSSTPPTKLIPGTVSLSSTRNEITDEMVGFASPTGGVAKHRALSIMPHSISMRNPSVVTAISRKPTTLKVGELEGAALTQEEARAVLLCSNEMKLSHTFFGGMRSSGINPAPLRSLGKGSTDGRTHKSLMLMTSPTERVFIPISPTPLIPAYEKDQLGYHLIAALSAFIPHAPKIMSNIGTPAGGVMVSSLFNGKELKGYFRTSLIPFTDVQLVTSTGNDKTTKKKTKKKKVGKSKDNESIESASSRLWLLDIMGGTAQILNLKNKSATVYEDRQLIRLERSTEDHTLLHMTFFSYGHHIYSEYFPSIERREQFYMMMQTMRPSCRVYCPPLVSPPPNNYTVLYTVPGQRIEVFSNPNTAPLNIEGECQVRASSSPTETISVWTGTMNVNGFPIHNPDTFEQWLPMDDKYDVYAVCIQEASYRRGEDQFFKFLQSYFENPPINRTIDNHITRDINTDKDLCYMPRYRLVAKVGLFDIQLAVFCRSNYWLQLSNIDTTCAPVSPECYNSERGAVGVSFNLMGSSFCFAGVHFPGVKTPDHDNLRRALINEVFTFMSIRGCSLNADVLNQFDYFFILGDINFPIRKSTNRNISDIYESFASGTLHRYVAENDLLVDDLSKPLPPLCDGDADIGDEIFSLLSGPSKLVHDMEGRLMNTGLLLSGFREPEIHFLPTYCIDFGSSKYNLFKVLGPNYPDRILVKCPFYLPPLLSEDGSIAPFIEIEQDEEEKNSISCSSSKYSTSNNNTPTRKLTQPYKYKKEGTCCLTNAAAKAHDVSDEAANFPLKCIQYVSQPSIRTSDHTPVTGVFICKVLRPIVSIFMKEARWVTIKITDLKIVGIAFVNNSSSQGSPQDTSPKDTNIISGAAKSPPGDYRPCGSLTLELSIPSYLFTVSVPTEELMIKALSNRALGAQLYRATFPQTIILQPPMPTTPNHLCASNMMLILSDNNDPDVYRGRRGSCRFLLNNLAGPLDDQLQGMLDDENVWDLCGIPFMFPLELAGTRCGKASGVIQVTYDKQYETE